MMKQALKLRLKHFISAVISMLNKPAIRSVGYRQLWDYFEGHYSLNEAVERAVIATRQLAQETANTVEELAQGTANLVDGDDGFTIILQTICVKVY